jgi:hypothetical protein
MRDIGDECAVTSTTISDWLDRHGIESRDHKDAQRTQQSGKHTDREWLAEQYWGKERSLEAMADACGVDKVTVMNWMDRHDMPRRGATRHKRVSPANFKTLESGYERVASKRNGEFDQAKVHQLVAIAEGADPYKVFSNGAYECHHVNGVKWDNRPANIELLTGSEHDELHAAERYRAATGEFL